jgi:hypothetical protein
VDELQPLVDLAWTAQMLLTESGLPELRTWLDLPKLREAGESAAFESNASSPEKSDCLELLHRGNFRRARVYFVRAAEVSSV